MAMLGWVALGLGLVILSMVMFVLSFLYMGTYTIGGAINRWWMKVACLVSTVVIGYLWVMWAHAAPFTITMK